MTAEAIASLLLHDLELVVLSACETGLGDVAGGERVFSLQRAFHQAGARNVIASLRKVDDEATAVLMSLLYHNLWVEDLPPIEALRRAQLAVYRHPEQVANWRARGLDFDEVVELIEQGDREQTGMCAPPALWAGFVLSGEGR